MSTVSSRVEHLVRAAVHGINKNPETWHQGAWVSPNTECGTSYCVGGWMLLYDGFRHERNENHAYVWWKGHLRVTDPYSDYLEELVYGDAGHAFSESIFDAMIRRIDELVHRIEDQLEINFDEECPCLSESEVCNLQGCPCGIHRGAAVTVVTPDIPEDVLEAAVRMYATLWGTDGRRVTAEQVKGDKHLMSTLSATFKAGAHSTVLEVTTKANRRIAEINASLQDTQKHRDDLVVKAARDDQRIAHLTRQLRGYSIDEYGNRIEPEAPWERDVIIRSLQGRIDDLRDGTRRTPEFRKMKAALRDALAKQDIDHKNIVEQYRKVRDLENELTKQKRVVRDLQMGFNRPSTTAVSQIASAVSQIESALMKLRGEV